MLEPVPMLGIEGKGLSLMISFEMNDNLVTEINLTVIELNLTLFHINCILFLSSQMNNSIFKSCKLWWYLIKSWGYPPDKETVFTRGLFIFC